MSFTQSKSLVMTTYLMQGALTMQTCKRVIDTNEHAYEILFKILDMIGKILYNL